MLIALGAPSVCRVLGAGFRVWDLRYAVGLGMFIRLRFRFGSPKANLVSREERRTKSCTFFYIVSSGALMP